MKKPTATEFLDIVEKMGGNMTDVANAFGVSRTAVYNWINEDEEFKNIKNDSRKKLFDRCLESARYLACGIPKVENGQLKGWIERPDPATIRYLLSVLGRDEGFGNNIDLTSAGDRLPTVINLIRSDDSEN